MMKGRPPQEDVFFSWMIVGLRLWVATPVQRAASGNTPPKPALLTAVMMLEMVKVVTWEPGVQPPLLLLRVVCWCSQFS